MQIVRIYAAFDRKAQYYLPVFQQRSDAEAIRAFTEAIVSSESNVSKYPAEYDLVHLANLNIETGEVSPQWPVGLIINGLVALQAHEAERARYAKALSPQMDIEEIITQGS